MSASETVYIFEDSCSKSKEVWIHQKMLKKNGETKGNPTGKKYFKKFTLLEILKKKKSPMQKSGGFSL